MPKKCVHQLILKAWSVVVFCAVVLISSTSSQAQTALPEDITVAPPDSTVARGVAVFSGAWLGAWGGDLATALIVEQIDSNGQARVVYSWGDLPSYHVKTGWSRETGRIAKGELKLPSNGEPKIEFTLETNGLLLGKYEMANQPPSLAELHRLSTTNVAAILEAARKPAGGWEEIRIPMQSHVAPTEGKNFGLQTTIYRQDSAGKHPVVICNHGSTGPGIVPANYVFRGGNFETLLHSLGYVVVIPMRKGRGSSDGPYLEEDFSLAPAVQLDSAIEDLDAVVKYVRRQPDVDPAKIIVSGVSRGGLLSVAYAARYPTNVAGVINFSGGWFGEGHPSADFNFETYAKAGHDAKVPMLWLYADHDTVYSLKFNERAFSKFRNAGGRGELVEVRNISGDGHALFMWIDRWQDKVMSYLKGF